MDQFYQRHFLRLLDFSSTQITMLLDLASSLKQAKKNGTEQQKLVGKNMAMLTKLTLK